MGDFPPRNVVSLYYKTGRRCQSRTMCRTSTRGVFVNSPPQRLSTFYRNARIPVPPFDSCSSSLLGLFRGCSLGCVCFELMAKLALVVYAFSPLAFRTCRGRRRRAGRGVSPLPITLPKKKKRVSAVAILAQVLQVCSALLCGGEGEELTRSCAVRRSFFALPCGA